MQKIKENTLYFTSFVNLLMRTLILRKIYINHKYDYNNE